MARPRILYYHDGRHPLIYMYEPPMQKEEVGALMFCLGDDRTLLRDTRVGGAERASG